MSATSTPEKWMVEVHFASNVMDYVRELETVLKRVGSEGEVEVAPASKIVAVNKLTKNHARAVMDWTMDFWFINAVMVRKQGGS